jgi:hypothetical protein
MRRIPVIAQGLVPVNEIRVTKQLKRAQGRNSAHLCACSDYYMTKTGVECPEREEQQQDGQE